MLIAITPHAGARLAEVGFVLDALAGAALFFGVTPGLRSAARVVAGLLLAVGSVLLIVAVHWGHFG